MKQADGMKRTSKLLEIIETFLPNDLSVIRIGADDKVAIIEHDIDDDGNDEILTIYKKDEKYYLLGLGVKEDRWKILWNRQLRYDYIGYFKLTQLEHKMKYEIAIAGTIPGKKQNQLMILEFKEGQLITLFREYIGFDKIEIKDADDEEGREEIILWQKTSSQYRMEVYHYTKGEMILIIPTIEEKEDIASEVMAEAEEQKVADSEWMFLEGITGDIEGNGGEEDIFLLAEKKYDYCPVETLHLMITSKGKEKKHPMKLKGENIQSYQMIVGRFLGIDKEQVFIKINEQDSQTKSWLIGLEANQLRDYMGEIGRWEIEREDIYRIQSKGEIYVGDFTGEQIYDIYSKHDVFKGDENEIIGAYIRWFKGDDGDIKIHKTMFLKEE